MSLPSQTARTTPAGRTFVYRGRRRRRNLPPQVLAIAAGGLAVLGLLIGGGKLIAGGPDEAEAQLTAQPAQEPAAPDAARDPARGIAAAQFRTTPTASEPAPTQRPPRPADTAPVRSAPFAIDNGPARSASRDAGPLGSAVTSGEPIGRVPDPAGALPPGVAEPSSRTAVTPPPQPQSQPQSQPRQAAEQAGATLNPANASASAVRRALDAAEAEIRRNQPVVAREILNKALRERGVTELDRAVLRDRLAKLNDDLLFSPRIYAGDPITSTYRVQRGDALARIVRSRDLGVHWKLIQRVNGLTAPERIRVGQDLKLVHGPFHAVVTKSAFRLDIYHGPTELPNEWTYIRSFRVGLGEGDSTPVGRFIVKPKSKLINPAWVNPRTGEQFGRDDPKNPIGEYWIAMEGLGDAAAYTGYGIHGTIEPDSIGQQKSMGCVRLGDDDVAFVFELLEEGISIIEVRP